MMAGIFLGGRHLVSGDYVDFFLVNRKYKYNYIYGREKYDFNYGSKETCGTDGMYHAAPVILAFWSE